MSITTLLESDTIFGFGAQLVSENVQAFKELEEASDVQKKFLGMSVDKVAINGTEGDYLIEYSNNIERYIKDQQLFTVEEAMENICDYYDIKKEECTIVVGEEDIDKIDIGALRESYNVIRK